ncbi:RNA polymerase II degradation factor 1-like [Anopheles stephensi]|uniref:RNA polymerase II degradation factor 1-like n=1 Tax=Anopheles stephensi TaxID=30069 RepID=UPI0016589DDA|nr:RNA polymerase II degradation factor 1-like [Anopheles stephensi]XP_035919468.1 RNA polymerase II degradation factor 1-like [Anopheles stephensi]XP_035919469.1 RNA polymerase II degradation factor 1-like [Anopheles stephensi]XP_035919470.1 RNA polymerase II degradation factor 1-like [Anopheles stephensi]XP_035919471.1 RNA polymerase II degradation factor 1-like [Anopheles stephensi]
MRMQGTWLTLAVGIVVLAAAGNAQTRRQQQQQRLRQRVLAAPSSAEYVDSSEDGQQQDNRPQAQQYYARAQERLGDVVLVASSDEDYGGGQYGAPVAAARPRADTQYQRPVAKSTTAAPVAARQKAPASESRAPPVQTIRNYSKVNDDGSFTFGYEAADGSFKEETRGTDCVVRGKYGYIDPDGNKREFTYVSGNPCDPNNPDGSEEEENDRSEGGQDDSNENVPQNYPVRRPVAIARPTPAAAPARHHSTPAPAARPTTTVFQNDYQDRRQQESAADAEEEVQIGQRGSARPAARPFAGSVTTTQRPRVQIVSTTPNPTPTIFHSPAPQQPQTVLPVNITPKPVYRVSPLPTQPTLAPTTYRPTSPSTRGPSIDFEAEFKRFQADNKLPSPSTPSAPSTAPKPTGSPFGRPGSPQLAAGNPIYQSQLIFDPASGQYDTALYQQLPQSDGDFQLNHRIQPYVAGPQQQQQHHQHPGAGQLVTLEQLQQQSPLYRAQPAQPARPVGPPTVQIPQQLYQKQQNELQFINSQQLFAQQLELQQSQLRADRIEAAKKVTSGGPPMHRFQPQPQQQQQYYFIQPQGPPQGAPGQIDAFLRGHNIDY